MTFMKQTLQIEKNKVKMLDKNRSLYDNIPKEQIRNNDEKKVRWVDNLFEGTANLIYFFEFINEHPELIDRFSDDIGDMCGLKAFFGQEQPAFVRLVSAIIGEGHPSDFGDHRFDYRYRFSKLMQFLITQKSMQFYANPKNPDYQRDTGSKDIVWNCFRQAQIYTRLMDRSEIDKLKKRNRIIDY